MIYCYGSNTCGNCISPYSVQCGGNAYSTVNQLCDNANSSQRFQQSIYAGKQFSIVAQWTVVIPSAGYQQIIANTLGNMMNRTALVGDILGFQGQYIAKTVSTDSTEDYRCVTPTISGLAFTCAATNLSSNNTRYQYLLQITIIQAVQIAPNTMFNNAGDFYVQGTLTQANVTSVSASSILPVVYGIEWIEIIGPTTANINVESSFIANIYPVSQYPHIFTSFILHASFSLQMPPQQSIYGLSTIIIPLIPPAISSIYRFRSLVPTSLVVRRRIFCQ